MGSRLKEDERNERAIRNLLKLPENRRCINCNSLLWDVGEWESGVLWSLEFGITAFMGLSLIMVSKGKNKVTMRSFCDAMLLKGEWLSARMESLGSCINEEVFLQLDQSGTWKTFEIKGPQYVCTSFWTFVCTTCSGIHREFTHRVKSVSMAKFTTQEVSALQGGGNAVIMLHKCFSVYFGDNPCGGHPNV
ncbi:putative Arf GTPase activating protein [Helianthus annuus]|nr:putative Arf GTPase activating protein [Helianthus annuus]